MVEGVARGCRANQCALIGGETAEMPGVYSGSDFDLVGCIVGTVTRSEFVDGSQIVPGDRLLGFPSTGLHTNGYSLARKVLFEDGGVSPQDEFSGSDTSVGDALLKVHRSYLPELKALKGFMKAAAHITGGGLPGNLSRVLPSGTAATVDVTNWTCPPIFRLIIERGSVPTEDAYKTFNMGIGLVAVVARENVEECVEITKGIVIGEIVSGDQGLTLEGETRW